MLMMIRSFHRQWIRCCAIGPIAQQSILLTTVQMTSCKILIVRCLSCKLLLITVGCWQGQVLISRSWEDSLGPLGCSLAWGHDSLLAYLVRLWSLIDFLLECARVWVAGVKHCCGCGCSGCGWLLPAELVSDELIRLLYLWTFSLLMIVHYKLYSIFC